MSLLYIILHHINYLFLELEQKNKKAIDPFSGPLKVQVTIDTRPHSIPGILRINDIDGNFSFSHRHVLWLEFSLPKQYVGFLTPATYEWDLIWNRVFADGVGLPEI